MVSSLADRRGVSEDQILSTMTLAQIQLRFFFLIREQHRFAKIQANSLAEVLAPMFQALAIGRVM